MPAVVTRPALVLLLLLLAGCGRSLEAASPEAQRPDPGPLPTLTALPAAAAALPPRADIGVALPSITLPTRALAPTRSAATATALPAPTGTPRPAAALLALTTGGCCTQPFWSPDGRAVRFIDRPSTAPAAIWQVAIDAPGSPPTLVTARIGSYSPDGRFFVELSAGPTQIERLADGQRWAVETRGNTPLFSPDGQRIAWSEQDRSLPFDQRVADIWIANVDGSGAQRLLSIPRGGVQGWLTPSTLLLSGRQSSSAPEQRLYALTIADGSTVELARSDRLRGVVASPDGGWLAYSISQSSDTAQNGLWLVRTDGSARHELPAELFGSYQWRSEGQLLLIPMRLNSASHELWAWDAASRTARALTAPAQLSFKVANADWRVAPDGSAIAFVESRDDNIWLLTLGE